MIYKLSEKQSEYVTWLRDNILDLPIPYYDNDDDMESLKGSLDAVISSEQYGTRGKRVLSSVGAHYADAYRAYLSKERTNKLIIADGIDYNDLSDALSQGIMPESLETMMKQYLHILKP